MRYLLIYSALLIFTGMLPGFAVEAVPTAPVSVEARYPGLTAGTLAQARLVALPEPMLLRAGPITITNAQLDEGLAQMPAEQRTQLEKNRFYLLELLAVNRLLEAEATAWAQATKLGGKEEDELLRAYLQSVVDNVTVSDAEVRAFYTENKALFGEAEYEEIADALKEFVRMQKREDAVAAHIRTLGVRTPIEVSETWTQTQAATAFNNPVDQARRAGKPALVEFGASGCGPCDMMAPVLHELGETYAAQATVFTVDVRTEEVLAARYGIERIPVQVIFDKNGKETFRHLGYLPREQILAELAKVGVQ